MDMITRIAPSFIEPDSHIQTDSIYDPGMEENVSIFTEQERYENLLWRIEVDVLVRGACDGDNTHLRSMLTIQDMLDRHAMVNLT